MNDSAVEAFFERHGFRALQPPSEALLAEFDRQMTSGLSGGAGSLAMIPAYLSGTAAVPAGKTVLAMDAGGTNLRVALVEFDARGEVRLGEHRSHPMPGTEGRELGADEFFGELAGFLEPLAGRADTLGLCFSYPTEITPDCDGRLLRWTKQVRAEAVVGRKVGSGVAAAFRKRTGQALRVRVLNDTVATLLAGRSAGLARRFSGYVGFILGTGTNTAYRERRERIAKLPEHPAGERMIINVESGNFDGVPTSELDQDLDRTLPDAGSYRFEKMIAGAYLGRLGLCVLRRAAAEGLFSARAAAGLLALRELGNKDFDDFTANPFLSGTVFDAVDLSDDDRRTLIALGTPLFRRAARFAAVNIAAAVLRSGEGLDPLHPVCVTVDGSTYYRTRTAQLKSRIEQHLRELLEPRGIACELVSVPDAPLLGAAVAGLTG